MRRLLCGHDNRPGGADQAKRAERLAIPDPIPDDLLRFLNANVDSVEQLELLRLVGESAGQRWDVCKLAAEAQATPGSIAVLEQRGLLKTEAAGTETVCGFAAMPAETESMLRKLLELYKRRPVTLIKIVYDRGKKGIKAFADAFRLRKET